MPTRLLEDVSYSSEISGSFQQPLVKYRWHTACSFAPPDVGMAGRAFGGGCRGQILIGCSGGGGLMMIEGDVEVQHLLCSLEKDRKACDLYHRVEYSKINLREEDENQTAGSKVPFNQCFHCPIRQIMHRPHIQDT